MINLNTPVEELPKVGPAYAKKLKKFGVKTIQDLLFYFPARYDDFSEIIFISLKISIDCSPFCKIFEQNKPSEILAGLDKLFKNHALRL